MYKIVAFLQGPSEAVSFDVERYVNDQEYHQVVLLNSMSGRRLSLAFADLFPKIWWDNVIPRISDKIDKEHIARVVLAQRPKLIITFGGIAKLGVSNFLSDYENRTSNRIDMMHCHHPNARFKTQRDLNDFAERVRFYYDEQC